MKNLIAAICLFCSWNAHSYYAVVKVLEAPLLRAPSEHATVVQTVRKAQRVYLHPSQFLTKEFSMMNGPSDKEHDKEFYKTVDKNGTEAYIKRKYVKVIFKDEREQEKFITLTEVDETDYRLEEPLPRRYPLLDPLSGRGLFAFGVGPGHKTGYPYQTAVEAEQVSTQKGVVFTYQRNVPFDLTN
jgi:phage FluMu gp28-like protein